MWKVEYTKRFLKELASLPQDIQSSIRLIATSQKPLRGKMKATTASLASQPIACGC